jgi:rhamnosyl/mannosyltransferase
MAALDRAGISSMALVHRHERSLKTWDENVDLDGQRFRVVRTGQWLNLLFTPVSPAFPFRLRRVIRETSPDILHLHMPNPSVFWCLVLPSARRIHWIVHWHSDVVTAEQGWMMRLAYALYRPFEQAILRKADVVIATSEPYRDTSAALQPWLSKCRVVPLGMDPRRLPPSTKPQPNKEHPSGPLRVLAVGRLTYYKGFSFLIEAASKADDIHIDLVGDGEQRTELLALAARHDLQARTNFHGNAEESKLAQLLQDCDCLCLPSVERTEAFGLVLLEAMQFGKATLASDVAGSGMGWVVDHGVTGLLVPPRDSEALADAFRRLSGNRAALDRMGACGKEKFDKMFAIDQAVAGVVETYRSVLAGEPASGREHSGHNASIG